MTYRRDERHTPGDGYGPDVDPVTGDEAETEELPDEKRKAPLRER